MSWTVLLRLLKNTHVDFLLASLPFSPCFKAIESFPFSKWPFIASFLFKQTFERPQLSFPPPHFCTLLYPVNEIASTNFCIITTQCQHHSVRVPCPGQLSLLPWISLSQVVKNPPTMQETLVWFLGREDPLEKGTATHASIPAWRSPCQWGMLLSMGSQRVGHDWATFTFSFL